MFKKKIKNNQADELSQLISKEEFSIHTKIPPYKLWEYFENANYKCFIFNNTRMKFTKGSKAPITYERGLLKCDKSVTPSALTVLTFWVDLIERFEHKVDFSNIFIQLFIIQLESVKRLNKLAFHENFVAEKSGLTIPFFAENFKCYFIDDTEQARRAINWINTSAQIHDLQAIKDSDYIGEDLAKIITEVYLKLHNENFTLQAPYANFKEAHDLWSKYFYNYNNTIPNAEFLTLHNEQ